jgi:D-alanyl-D-alanine carboxypeptidase/D-alanyl-D-alanine-endopeptidase (penicillin-binding protein 4)
MCGYITNMSRNVLFVFLFALALPTGAQVPPVVAERLHAGGLPDDALAFTVQRVSDASVVADHGAQRPMQPASTLKLLTSLVALETLGPAFQGRSALLAAGEIRRGVLHGDLVLRGEADVDLDAGALERMLQSARLQGVREVRGDVLLDRTHFSPSRTDVGLAPFDETPEFRYNFIPDALSLNMSLVHLSMASDARSVRAAMSPALDGVSVAAAFTLVDRDCDDWEDGWVIPEVVAAPRGRLVIRLRGEFPRDCAASTDIHVIERDLFAERLVRAVWKRLGGTLRGRVREGAAPADAKVLARHRSRPLSELLADIEKHSDNPVTRVVYLAVGAASAAGNDLPTSRRAELAVRAWLAGKGIDDDGLVLENGSGLSRVERIKPAQLAAVVRAGLASEWAPEFLAGLPIAAVDGGLQSRLRGGAAARRARLKTGTLRNASALAGVVNDTRGESYVVAAMVNDDAAAKDVARPVLDALVEWVASRGFAGTTP